MDIAILIFDGITALDAVGPYDVLSNLPDTNVSFVGETKGIKRTSQGSLGLNADFSIGDIARTDILLVPGGFGEEQVRAKPAMLEWVRSIHANTRWTTSVCTGALILGAAGILKGLNATTHWSAREQLRSFGATPVKERVVEQGKIITGAGVSAGIDLALCLARRLAGDEAAQAIQVGIEYDPQPPFDGVFEHAPQGVLTYLMKRYEHRLNPAAARR
ncbi:MAG TPA: DJ-1/PfpI family protein [Candidatus Binataceae bacterium]|nr:DJ-1/PfpI family protein [Candidatus Binataceae bacterium]